MTVFEQMHELALQVDCPFCKAPRGEWCVTRSGNWAVYLHGARDNLAWGGYRIGYSTGWDAALRSAMTDPVGWAGRVKEYRMKQQEETT